MEVARPPRVVRSVDPDRAPLAVRRQGRSLDMDRVLQLAVSGYASVARARRRLGWRGEQWRPGRPLRLLLAGYNGARNTGADVRVAEIVRQLRHVLGADNAELTVLSLDSRLTAGYFDGARQRHLPQVFPRFLARECPRHHGVVACEGSMFKSQFADALSTMIAAALGLAGIEGKLAVGYGGEAGRMTESLRRFVAAQCEDALVLCRNESSRAIVDGELGLRSAPGTDTAWTFDPAPPARGARLLREAGWDGHRPVLIVCPVDAFWWPVRPSLGKALRRPFSRRLDEQHYGSIYFHHHDGESVRRQHAYLDALAAGVRAYCSRHRVFPVIVGMERIDRRACEQLVRRLPPGTPMLVSDQHDMFDLVSVLRQASMILSSRYHAIVTSMPALVPSVGITIDERIRHLMKARGHDHLLLGVDQADLADRVLETLEVLRRERESIAWEMARTVRQHLERMGYMGLAFMDEVARLHPEFPRPDLGRGWERHLPPLPTTVADLLDRLG